MRLKTSAPHTGQELLTASNCSLSMPHYSVVEEDGGQKEG